MAISKMMRLSMLAMCEDKADILKALQHLGCVQISSISDKESENFHVSGSNIDDSIIERLRSVLTMLNRYSTIKTGMIQSEEFVSRKKIDEVINNREQIMKIVETAELAQREMGNINARQVALSSSRKDFQMWEKLDIPFDKIKRTKNTVQFIGTMPTSAYTRIINDEAINNDLVKIVTLNDVDNTSYLYCLMHESCEAGVSELLRRNNFTQTHFEDVVETASQHVVTLQNQYDKAEEKKADLEKIYIECAKSIPEIQTLHDAVSMETQREIAENNFVATDLAFYLEGWVLTEKMEMVSEELKKISSTIDIEYREANEDEEQPVQLHNSAISRPFESVVTGFALPAANGFDPTAVMMPFFANFFGMMVSDAGYGLVMALLLPFIIKKVQPKTNTKNLLKLLAWGGGFTVLWGMLYNTWFGYSPLPTVFDPINNAMPVMICCVAIGAVHLFVGLGCAAYMSIKRKDYIALVFDQISWAILLVGLGFLIIPSLAILGKYMAIIAAAMIVVMAGRAQKNPFSRLISGLGSLYGVMNWVSDLLSYMRLFGMGLATGVIGMVINILVGMCFQGGIIGIVFGIVLFAGGHLFNLGINALGAYVHSCRLQYIEFFSKFYEEGGKPFTPLCENTRFYTVNDEKAQQAA